MGVQVAPGDFSSPYSTRLVIVWKNLANGKPYVHSDKTTERSVPSYGRKVTSTSPRIVTSDLNWSPAHPYTRSAVKISSLGGHLRRSRPYTYKGVEYEEYAESTGGLGVGSKLSLLTSPFVGSTGIPGPLSTNQRNRLITELLLKAGHRQISLGEAIGESRETVKLIASSTSRICKSLLSLRKGNYREVFKILGLTPKKVGSATTPANFWLEYQYGWMPLISDVYSGYQAFQKGLKRPQMIRAVRQIQLDEFNYSSRSGDGTVTQGQQLKGKSELSAKAVAYFRLKSEWIDYLQQLGLINPLEIAWALTPYSFVIDWLVPVQNVLEATTATVGLTFVDGSSVRRVKSDAYLGFSNHSDMSSAAGPKYSSDWSYMYHYQQFGMVREVLTDLTPGFYVKNPLSTTHAISALALLRQLKR